ncbi:hypothetical protein [Dysgonomonas sp. 520]|uniref:hypothetical protein n=1 Tax=Dysgonomonas sp. 520 TaxID=2302931 RepID=UPI0013D4C0D9|nr:hypothetical protein [Dysgonomonas sp. 520]NDW10922.1 hypothetical protein [Dysgonomonas sp. 520]
MKVFVFIQQKPLKVKTYTSLTALYEANKSVLNVSKSTLDKSDLNTHPYVDSRFIIVKTETLSSGDVRRITNQDVQKV